LHGCFAAISTGALGNEPKTDGSVQNRANSLASPEAEDSKDEDGNARVLISEVEIQGVDGQLREKALDALTVKPNFAYTLKEVKQDVQRVFATGYFSDVETDTEDTRDGIKLIVNVTANEPLAGVVVTGANALPASVITEAFAPQHGKVLNYGKFSNAVLGLNQWYEDRGIFGQVIDVDVQDRVANVKVAEAVVGKVNLRFVPIGGGEPQPHGNTHPEVILRQLQTRPGRVYNLEEAKRDIEAVYAMGIADDVTILPQAADGSSSEAPKVDLTLTILQRKTGGLSAGGGFSAQGAAEGGLPHVIGSFAYSQRNFLNRNQKVNAAVEIGKSDSMFRLSHTDPWVGGDPRRTSRTCSIMNTRNSGNVIYGAAPDDVEGAGAGLSIERLCGGVEYQQPLAVGWSGTAGLSYQRTHCLNERREIETVDRYGSPLTFSGKAHDHMLLGLLRLAFSGRGDTQLMASAEQALPVRGDAQWLSFTRLRLRAENAVMMGPCRLSARGSAGVITGDLPGYEAFPIGGSSSVRGYSEGAIGTGRSFVEGAMELSVPLVQMLDGAVFMDYGSDLRSGPLVLGDPAGARQKPGSGWGIGVGVRLDSPLGPLRLDYAMNDHKQRRFHLGIGSGG